MKNIKKKIGKDKTKNMLLFSLIQPILFIVFGFIFTVICYNSKDPTSNTELYSMAALLLAGGIGAFLITKLGGENGPYFAVISSVFSCILIFAVSLICRGKLSFGALMNIFCFILISAFFIFLGKRKRSSGGPKKHKRGKLK